jgi:hypothetical protein
VAIRKMLRQHGNTLEVWGDLQPPKAAYILLPHVETERSDVSVTSAGGASERGGAARTWGRCVPVARRPPGSMPGGEGLADRRTVPAHRRDGGRSRQAARWLDQADPAAADKRTRRERIQAVSSLINMRLTGSFSPCGPGQPAPFSWPQGALAMTCAQLVRQTSPFSLQPLNHVVAANCEFSVCPVDPPRKLSYNKSSKPSSSLAPGLSPARFVQPVEPVPGFVTSFIT